jgi:hypothetical protein
LKALLPSNIKLIKLPNPESPKRDDPLRSYANSVSTHKYIYMPAYGDDLDNKIAEILSTETGKEVV